MPMRAAIKINHFISSITKETQPIRTIYGKNIVMVQMYNYYLSKFLYKKNNSVYIFLMVLVSKQQDTYQLSSTQKIKENYTIDKQTNSVDGRTIMIDEPLDQLAPCWLFVKNIPSGDTFFGLSESEYNRLISPSCEDKEFLQYSLTK